MKKKKKDKTVKQGDKPMTKYGVPPEDINKKLTQ